MRNQRKLARTSSKALLAPADEHDIQSSISRARTAGPMQSRYLLARP